MRGSHSTSTKTLGSFVIALVLGIAAQAQSTSSVNGSAKTVAPEQRTARYLETIRKSPPQQLAFFLQMPKGGDLHNHRLQWQLEEQFKAFESQY